MKKSHFFKRGLARYTKGFTLTELLIVISIIAILSSIVLANLEKSRSKSRDTRRIADISQLQLALALYLNKHNTYPTALAELTSPVAYISNVPTDPKTDADYGYEKEVDGTYCLGATLENPSPYIDTTVGCTTDDATNDYKVTR